MRTMLFSVGLALTSVGLVLTACGSSSDDDMPGSGGSNHGGAAGASGAAASAGRFTPEAGAGGTAEGGASGAAEAGQGGAPEAGASGSAQAGDGGDSGAAGSANAGSANAGTGGTGGTGGIGGTGGTGGAHCPAQLLVGGSDITAQGWLSRIQTPAAITYGADYVRLETSTNSGASTSGQLLLYYPEAFLANQAFKIKVEMLVETASTHNLLDSGAAILGSFTSPFGNATDRGQMVYLDSAALGWADDTQSAAFAVTDGSYHTYVLSVDGAGLATLSVDGTVRLTRTGYVSNGTLAIGDQTNDPKVDGALRIRAVTRECP